MTETTSCMVDGCEKPRGVTRLCSMHQGRKMRTGTTDPSKYANLPAAEKFFLYVTPGPASECWLWNGSTGDTGYGTFRAERRVHLAHRWSYEHHVGPIPDGLLIRHTCDVRACVNPNHLLPGTIGDNMDDKAERGGAKWDTCAKGHEYTAENTHVYQPPNSRYPVRRCRICRREDVRKQRARKAALRNV